MRSCWLQKAHEMIRSSNAINFAYLLYLSLAGQGRLDQEEIESLWLQPVVCHVHLGISRHRVIRVAIRP